MNTVMNAGTNRRIELRTWHVAAGALFLLLSAFTSGTVAAQPKVATVTPVNAKSSVAPARAATALEPAATNPTGQAPDYRLETLGIGDMVRITVFRNPDLSTEARVSERGTIAFPLIGEVQVTGLTTTQLGNRIAEKLRAGKYVVNPEVTASVAQINSRQVSILGNVTRPGRYPLDATTGKLTDLIAVAGGISATGSDQITLVTTRDGKTVKQDIDLGAMIRTGDLSRNAELQPGDTIYVGRAPQVYIYGEVQRAGAYRVEKDMTVMQAIALGGGITPRGTERNIRIHRRNGDGQVHKIDARLTDVVQVDDVIYVRESLF